MRQLRILLVLLLVAVVPSSALAIPEPAPPDECEKAGGLWVPVVEECLDSKCPPRCPGSDILQRAR